MPIERYHNELRENLNSGRGLGNDGSAQIYMELLRIHHNFIRPHMGLEGKTPSAEAGLEGFSDTKYAGLIAKSYGVQTRQDYMDALVDLALHVWVINKPYCTMICHIGWPDTAVWTEINSILRGFGFAWVFDNHNRCWTRTGDKNRRPKKRSMYHKNKAPIRCKSMPNRFDEVKKHGG